ncbi:hypothetical protein EHS13_17310 [Paenibacillus psychroresistens]|uniref:Alpha galactosidase C-terminal domain-containing protein n=1 Tax=Paenibacillus psychroresistens TaxID=1778678 RepID=A0A6B8RME7_9BACL|nr:hypothetical protein [Paenibacillus psychroresistens]QGQ96518.1 hypothetical protein EHS13_17310 [Paenibacillus psychroresistens]
MNKKEFNLAMHKRTISGRLLVIVIIIFTFLTTAFNPSRIVARDSAFTRSGTGPLYWISYEYQYDNDTFLPYSRWLANVNWFAQNFMPYGYQMVSTDGWIEGATQTNQNGYVLSHNDSWLPEHSWNKVTQEVNALGLDMGVYYNPLWVTQAAVNDPTKKVIGTSISIKDIVAPGDFFTGNPNPSKHPYWVDVTKAGAEQYIKGYVDYFKQMNVKFLRIDFLSWFETGTDSDKIVGISHGSANYETALRWMSEAAGDDIELSFVMPHLKNHAATELKYGDMIRINEDVFAGGWEHLSGRRQTSKAVWSQWANTFQGLTAFSDISGHGSMVLDTDFQRLRKLNNDNEKQTSISLSIMAGAPIAMADQYDTLAPADYIFYQNEELLALNKQGFVGKPLYKNKAAYPINQKDSERWAGQLPNGDWVLGLFNRSDSSKTVKVNLLKTFGSMDAFSVRDLWGGTELGLISVYKTTLAPHAVKVLKLTSPYRTGNYYNFSNPSNINSKALHQQPIQKTSPIRKYGFGLLILLVILLISTLLVNRKRS